MRRSEIREHVFKLLFRVEFHEPSDLKEQCELYFNELEISEKDKEMIISRTSLIEENLLQIDEKLDELSVGWKKERLGKVELAIIRLALFEILFDEEVPTGVAINEAVELAKKFGGDESPSFVNGILGKISK